MEVVQRYPDRTGLTVAIWSYSDYNVWYIHDTVIQEEEKEREGGREEGRRMKDEAILGLVEGGLNGGIG